MSLKIVSIVGARPQFVKAAAISHEFLKHRGITEVIIHTGQHFDNNMSEVFFKQMKIPRPKYNFNIHSLPHGAMVGRMIEEIEKVLLKENPDWVMVYGDTNSTLAGSIAAKKLNKKLAHVEAGMRYFDMRMPEETNRIVADRLADVLFCPTEEALRNLAKEGFRGFDCKIIKVGDVMVDSFYHYKAIALHDKSYAKNMPKQYVLATIHRASNTDNLPTLKGIVRALSKINEKIPVIFVVHPRTRKIIEENKLRVNFAMINPVGYLEMLALMDKSAFVLTDSGGLQKEAYLAKKPCLVIYKNTAWVELVKNKFCLVTEVNEKSILNKFTQLTKLKANYRKVIYPQGAAKKIAGFFLSEANK